MTAVLSNLLLYLSVFSYGYLGSCRKKDLPAHSQGINESSTKISLFTGIELQRLSNALIFFRKQ